MADENGEIGESLSNIFLTRRTARGSLFVNKVIGGKWPTIDIYSEINSEQDSQMFCFFQVKSTELGYTNTNKLKINISKEDLNKLAKFNAPSYLIGIDYNPDNPFVSKAYIATIRNTYTKGIGCFPTTYELTPQNLILLHDEIVAFYNNLNAIYNKSNYNSSFQI